MSVCSFFGQAKTDRCLRPLEAINERYIKLLPTIEVSEKDSIVLNLVIFPKTDGGQICLNFVAMLLSV